MIELLLCCDLSNLRLNSTEIEDEATGSVQLKFNRPVIHSRDNGQRRNYANRQHGRLFLLFFEKDDAGLQGLAKEYFQPVVSVKDVHELRARDAV